MRSIAAPVRSVLILKADRLCANAIHRISGRVFPSAEIGEARLLSEALQRISEKPLDLLLAGTTLIDGDIAEFLSQHAADAHLHRTFIITGSHKPWLLERLQALPIAGVFDSSAENAEVLASALQQVAAGKKYWSKTISSCLTT